MSNSQLSLWVHDVFFVVLLIHSPIVVTVMGVMANEVAESA